MTEPLDLDAWKELAERYNGECLYWRRRYGDAAASIQRVREWGARYLAAGDDLDETVEFWSALGSVAGGSPVPEARK